MNNNADLNNSTNNQGGIPLGAVSLGNINNEPVNSTNMQQPNMEIESLNVEPVVNTSNNYNNSIPDGLPNTNVDMAQNLNTNMSANQNTFEPVSSNVNMVNQGFNQPINDTSTTLNNQMNNSSMNNYDSSSTVDTSLYNASPNLQTQNNLNPGFDMNQNYGNNVDMVNNQSVVVDPPVSENIKKSKKKGKGFLVFLLILLLVAVCAGGVWYFFLKDKFFKQSPREIFAKTFNSFNTDIELSDDFKTLKGNMSLVLESKNNGLKKVEFLLTTDIDKESSYYNYGVDFKYNGQSALNGDVYYLDKQLYVNSKQLYSNLLKVDSDYVSFDFKSFNTDSNIKVILDSYIKALKDSLKDEYFTQNTEDNLSVSTLNLTETNYKNIINDVKDNLKSNDEFINEMTKNSDKSLDEILSSFNSDIEDFSNMTISIYTNSQNSVVKVKVVNADEGITITFNNIITNGFDYEILQSDKAINGKVTINLTGNNPIFKMTMNSDEFTLTIDSSSQKNVEIEKDTIDTTQAQSISQLSEFDLEFMQLSLFSNNAIIQLLTDINSLSGSTSFMDYLTM